MMYSLKALWRHVRFRHPVARSCFRRVLFRHRLAAAGILVLLGLPPAQAQGPLPVHETTATDSLDEANYAQGVGDLSLGLGESVSLWNGNLQIVHPSSPSYPRAGYLPLQLIRAYSSHKAHYDHVRVADNDDGSPRYVDYLSGRSWLGLGWTLHFGRIFRAQEYVTEDTDGDGTVDSWRYGFSSAAWETPDGHVRFFEPTDRLAHPKIKYEEHPECPEDQDPPRRPEWCDRHPDYPSCHLSLEDDCDNRPPGDPAYWVVIYPDGSRRRLEKLVDEKSVDGSGWIRNHDRWGFYTKTVTDVYGHVTTIRYWHEECLAEGTPEQTCDERYPFREAIKSVETSDYRLDFSVYGMDDAPDPALVGMLKEIRGRTVGEHNGEVAKEIRYVFSYDLISLPDGDAGESIVPLLREVSTLGSDGTDGGRVVYEYGTPVSGNGDDACCGPLLTRIRYPLGAVVEYEYGTWVSGQRAGTAGGEDTPREITGIVRRVVHSEGIAGEGEPPRPRAEWRWARNFSAANCADLTDRGEVNQHYEMTLPDGRRWEWRFYGHPCGKEDNDDWGPVGAVEEVSEFMEGEDSPYLRKRYTWDYHRDLEGRIVAVLASKETIAWLDDVGGCFGDGTADGTARTMSVRRSGRNDWDLWRNVEISGDLMREGRTRRITTDYESSNDAERCRLSNHVIGAWRSREIVEDGWKTVTYGEFDCQGRLTRTTVSQEWVSRGKTDDECSPGEGDDVVREFLFDQDGQLVERRMSGGDSPEGDGGEHASYGTTFSWEKGVATEVRSTGFAYADLVRTVDDAGRVVAFSDGNGEKVTLQYDALGRTVATEEEGGQIVRISYPSLKRAVAVASPDGAATYDASNPMHQYRETVVDGLGRLREQKRCGADGGMEVQVLRYDAFGRVIFVSRWMEESEYDAADKVRWETAAGDYYVTGIPLGEGGRPDGVVYYYGVPEDVKEHNPLRVRGESRVRRQENPDGSVLLKEYCGPHEMVGPDSDGNGRVDVDQARKVYKDGMGRIVVVDAPGAAADVTYRYDALGNLVEAKLFDGSGGDLFERWRRGELDEVPTSQERSFCYDGAGRLTQRFTPEEGRAEVWATDGGGRPLVWTDQAGSSFGWDPLSRQYYYRATYDGKGRLTKIVKRTGSYDDWLYEMDGYDEHSMFSEDGSFENGLANWEEGTLQEGEYGEEFVPGDSYWRVVSYGELPGVEKPSAGDGGHGLAFSNGDDYGDAPRGPQAVRYYAWDLSRDSVLSFSFWRDVRGNVPGRDSLRIYVLLPRGNDVQDKRLVMELDSGQESYGMWRRWPDIRPGDLFTKAEWPEGERRDIYILIVFEKGDEAPTGTGLGVVIDEMFVGRHGESSLVEFAYDESHCDSGAVVGEACRGASAEDHAKGKLTTVVSYSGGRPVARRRYVYRGTGGRLSAVEDWYDWTGHAEAAGDGGSTWVSRYSWDEGGYPVRWSSPYIEGEEVSREYEARYRHGFLESLKTSDGVVLLGGPGGLPGVEYTPDWRAEVVRYGNGTETRLQYDPLGRMSEISVLGKERDECREELWSTGEYRYDWRGNVVGIGPMNYEYDVSGRLTRAEVLPQAHGVDQPKETLRYSYDLFGNLTERDWGDGGVSEGSPAGLEIFNRVIDVATNRIVGDGYEYDRGGRQTRFPGKAGQEVGATWDDLGRVAAFYEGSPEDGGRPAEVYGYGGDGWRFLRLPVGRDGVPRILLEDAFGRAAAVYVVEGGSGGPSLRKEFVHAAGMMIAERVVVGSRQKPLSVTPTDGDGSYELKMAGAVAGEVFDVEVRTGDGCGEIVKGVVAGEGGIVRLPRSSCVAGRTNFVRLRKVDGRGEGEWSAWVSVLWEPGVNDKSENQVCSVAVMREGSTVRVRWAVAKENGKEFVVKVHPNVRSDAVVVGGPLPGKARSFSFDAGDGNPGWGGLEVGQVGPGGGASPGPGVDPPVGPGAPGPVRIGGGGGGGDDRLAYQFETRFFHRDHLRSLRLVTGEDGEVVESVDYYPYGLEMVPPDGSVAESSWWKYEQHARDEGTGLDWVGARYKAARDVVLLSPDPVDDIELEFPGSWNKYAWVGSNPMTIVDPWGLASRQNSTCKDENGDGKDDKTGLPCPAGGGGWGYVEEVTVTASVPEPEVELVGVRIYTPVRDGDVVVWLIEAGMAGPCRGWCGGGGVGLVLPRKLAGQDIRHKVRGMYVIVFCIAAERIALYAYNGMMDGLRRKWMAPVGVGLRLVGAVAGAAVDGVGASAGYRAGATGAGVVNDLARKAMKLDIRPGDTIKVTLSPYLGPGNYYTVRLQGIRQRYQGQNGACP